MRRSPSFIAPFLAAALLLIPASASSDEAETQLRFLRHSKPVASRALSWLERSLEQRTVRVYEPYEEREVSFKAFALDALLDAVYSDQWRSEEELLFTCSDGYQPSLPVQRVLDHRAWLAVDRADEAGFSILKRESGAHKRIELGPAYLIWENLEDPQLLLEGDYGWPYQLVAIDLIRPRQRFPTMAPPPRASDQAERGFSAFRIHCSRCHKINGAGGSVGPELNHPVNPIEYREREWLRRWIDDPSQVVAGARMPRLNPSLPNRSQLVDDILAYLESMSDAKLDAMSDAKPKRASSREPTGELQSAR